MGAQPELDRQCVRFGVFELNTATGELRKHGVRVRLQDQPLKLLLCLIETPGAICAREDLIHKIWPAGTFVDYEHGLNAAITRLRQVMGDSADTPRYVETLGRKGYRFIAPVERMPAPDSTPPAPAVVAPKTLANQPRLSRLWPYIAVLAIGLGAGGIAVRWRATPPVSLPLMRLNVELGRDTILAGPGTLLALSHDGARLAVTFRDADGKVRLAIRRLDQNQLTPLPGTEGAGSPFFSPDGQWIAFFADGKLKKIAVQGGAPVTLSDAFTFRRGPMSRFPAGGWGDDGNIIAMLNPTVGLTRIASTGGQPAPLTVLAKAEGVIDNWPQVLPGSQAVLFTRLTGDIDYDSGNIEVVSLKTGIRKTVLKGGFLGRYLPSGHLVYVHQNVIFAAPFDLSRLETAGTPQPVLLDVGGRLEVGGSLGCRNFDFSQTGSFLVCQQGNPPLSIFWLDSSGAPSLLQDVPGSSYSGPRFSPDGKRLAFSMTAQGHQDIWVQDLDRGAASRITALPGVNDNPVWTADGRNLVFRSSGQPKPGIYGVRADGSVEAQRLLDPRSRDFPYSVSPDGKRLALWDSVGGMIWTVPVESSRRSLSLGKAEPFLQAGRFNPALPGRSAPAFSPDGRWMAYCSNESGQLEVYVVPFPGPGGKWRISTGGGKFPVWSRSGRELFFLDLESNTIMVTSYTQTADSFSAAKPRVWSGKRLMDLGTAYPYDLAPDGKRFAAVLYADGSAEQKPVTNLTFLLNFFDELKRRVPVTSAQPPTAP